MLATPAPSNFGLCWRTTEHLQRQHSINPKSHLQREVYAMSRDLFTDQQNDFTRNFLRDYSSPFAIQQPEGERTDWRTKYHPVTADLVKSHLEQRFWIGTKASWYPVFFNLDIDRPEPKTLDTIFSRLDSYNIGESQRALMTSPSHAKNGNFRIYLKLEYNDRLPTWKLGNEALNNAFGDLCEVYPQQKRKDRLPCGKHQDLITEDGRILEHLTWQEELHYLLKIDPVAIESLPRQRLLEFPEESNAEQRKAWTPRGEVAQLRNEGLQAHSTRHEAQFKILNDLWRSNFQPQDASRYVKTWIRKNHNGFSKDAAAGRWQSINTEIDRQVKWIWARPQTLLPDTPHSLNSAITKADLKLAAELFKGDAVKQKQFIKLASFIRPRQHHEWVFVPAWVWREEIASKDTYKKLIAELESKGILEVNNSYRVAHYSRRFKLKLPKTNEQPISVDGRNEADFYNALWKAFDESIREIAEATGIDRTTIWRNFKKD